MSELSALRAQVRTLTSRVAELAAGGVGGGGAQGPQGEQGEVGPAGPEGPAGADGFGVFVQETAPTATDPFLWVEIDSGGNVESMWVGP